MIYVNGSVLDLNTIKITSEGNTKYYDGTDEIKKLFAEKWKELDRKFFSNGTPLVFKTPGIKSGGGKGNQGYFYPRVVDFKSRKGKVRIAWADDIESKDGKVVYKPISRRIGPNEKTLSLGPEDIEEALFASLFNPFIVNEKNPMGQTFIEDKEADAVAYEQSETNQAVISYWLFRKESVFYSSDTHIATLCLAWGVDPNGKSITYKKQLLAEAVKKAEKRNDIEFNLKAFNESCERLKDGNDTRDIEIRAVIQKAVNGRIIKYDADKLAWMLLGVEGNALKTLCKVPPQQAQLSRNILLRHLLTNPDDVHTLHSALADDPIPSRHDRCLLSIPLPEDVTEEFLTNELPWPDWKKIYQFLGHSAQGAKKEDMLPVLIEHFIVNKKTVPYDVKKS